MDDRVSRQYTEWPYPEPIGDVSAYAAEGNYQGGDPSLFGPRIFPERGSCDDLDILVAGCGTNQAATYAFKNPKCRILGIDFSETSLAHERTLKEQHKLNNLSLARLDLLSINSLNRAFDYIVCTGVLHHLPDPDVGLSALRSVLRPKGALAVSVYSKHHRAGVYVVQDAFRHLELDQSPEDAQLAKDTLALLPDWHPGKPVLSNARDTKTLAGVVDLCLHRVDQAFTVDEFFDYLARNGFAFQCWQDGMQYSTHWAAKLPIYRRLLQLPEQRRFAVIDALFPFGLHQAFVRRDDLDPSTYLITFSGDAFLKYVPVLPKTAKLTVDPSARKITLARAAHQQTIEGEFAAMLSHIDGKRAVIEAIGRSKVTVSGAREFYQFMWDSGDLMFRKPASDQGVKSEYHSL